MKKMRAWAITFKRFNGDINRVKIGEDEEFVFGDSEPENPKSMLDVIILFEEVARKWWGTNEDRNNIIKIEEV